MNGAVTGTALWAWITARPWIFWTNDWVRLKVETMKRPFATSVLLIIFLAATAIAADSPYNEAADAKLDIKQALTQPAANKIPVIIVFGANWCGDCKMLDSAMKNGASAPLLSKDFKIVKVNVGHFDKNLDVAKAYGVPLQMGIPAVAIISTNNQVVYVTREGELANARKMGDDGIYEFFKRVTTGALAKK
jgi:thioredoxin 1